MTTPHGTRGPTEEISFAWSGLTLAGTLHLPTHPDSDRKNSCPTILMLQGSGPSDRDSGGFFEPIRQAFLSRGIATYSFDKPGCGASSGDWRQHGLENRADQALAALDILEQHPVLDRRRLGIFGHSQGGWLVQLLAARHGSRLALAIANSAPSIGVAEQNLYGCEHTLRQQGFTEPDVEAAVGFMSELHEAAHRNEEFTSVEARLLRTARREPWYGYLVADDEADWPEFCLWANEPFEPIDALCRIRCPILATYGALDPLVPPWRSARESAQALAEAGNDEATIVVFPTGNHRLQLAGSEQFVPGYLDLIGDWARRRFHTLAD